MCIHKEIQVNLNKLNIGLNIGTIINIFAWNIKQGLYSLHIQIYTDKNYTPNLWKKFIKKKVLKIYGSPILTTNLNIKKALKEMDNAVVDINPISQKNKIYKEENDRRKKETKLYISKLDIHKSIYDIKKNYILI